MTTNVRRLTEGAIAIALAAVLHQVRIYQAPYGGSITAASMVPIFVYALRWGPGWGVGAGVLDGLVVYVLEPYFVGPAQFLLDYPVAFGLLGLAGFFVRQPVVGVFVGGAARFVSHFVSGVLFFAQYAPKGMSPVAYSLLYNGAYMLPEVVISIVLGVLVLRALPRTQPAV